MKEKKPRTNPQSEKSDERAVWRRLRLAVADAVAISFESPSGSLPTTNEFKGSGIRHLPQLNCQVTAEIHTGHLAGYRDDLLDAAAAQVHIDPPIGFRREFTGV